jgi:Mono-functional DNA-alkylating methyl methanesulfonate N-term
VPNWSPVADCQLVGNLIGKDEEDVVSRSLDPLALTFASENRDRLYVGAGHRTEGSLKELRTGLKTNVTVEFELEQYVIL